MVNLAKISLDYLRNILKPVFETPFQNLPKSVRDWVQGETDCPVYRSLAGEHVLEYLLDIRTCLVHFRSFAKGPNAIAYRDGAEHELEIHGEQFQHWAKAYFRIVGKSAVSVNFCLPDRIFERSGTEKMVPRFTFTQQINLLAQSLQFVNLTTFAVVGSLRCLKEAEKPIYHWAKAKK